MIVELAMALVLDAAKTAPMTPYEFAANCKAAARVMQERYSVATDHWRDYQRDVTYWEGRHRDAEGDPMRRDAQDAAFTRRFASIGVGRAHPDRRRAAEPVAANCRQIRERAR